MSNKTCQETIALLMDYLEDRLSPEERAALDHHFAACPPCVDFLRSYEETPRIFREATDPPIPPEVRERLARFLATKKGSR